MTDHNLPDLLTAPLREIVVEAWRHRNQFDLGGVGYGRIHWGNSTDVLAGPTSYYFFLAALAFLTSSRRIVEIGTRHGGSARALCAGLREPDASRLVTFDINDEGSRLLAGHPVIRAFALDGNSETALDICIRELGGPRADLVYIDADHTYWPTLINFLVYGVMLGAKFVVIDDINLNPEMRKFWALICTQFGDDAIDAASIVKEIRSDDSPEGPGFGLVRCRAAHRTEMLNDLARVL
jgi:predicted O-methyltransferase YrrM